MRTCTGTGGSEYHGRMANSSSLTVRSVELPTGGKLAAAPIVRAQPPDCSAATNLQMQVAPWLASMSCQFLILKLLPPLIEIIRGLPSPSVSAVENFLKIAVELAPCLAAPTAAGVLPFIRDLLCLEIESLTCLRHNLQAMARLTSTEPSGVTAAELQSVIDSYQPIVGVLTLAKSMFEIAGVSVPQPPPLAAGTNSASLASDQDIIAAFIADLQTVASALGGCS
jgi:hypothetical protein